MSCNLIFNFKTYSASTWNFFICVVFVVYTWVRPPVSSHLPYAACVGWLASWKLRVVSLKYQYFDTVFRQWKCDRTITICVNAYRKRTVRTVLTNIWHQIQQYISDSTTKAHEYRPEPYGPNSTTTPADILTLLCAWLLPIQVSAKPDT